MTNTEIDYDSESGEQPRIKRCGRTVPADSDVLFHLEEERRLCALLEPLMF